MRLAAVRSRQPVIPHGDFRKSAVSGDIGQKTAPALPDLRPVSSQRREGASDSDHGQKS